MEDRKNESFMKHKIAFLALLLVYSIYFIMGQILVIRFGFNLVTWTSNGPWSILTGNFLFDGYGNVLYFVGAMVMVALLVFFIGATFSNKMYISLMILPFILSSVGMGIAYSTGGAVSGQSGVMSVFGGMFVVYVTLEYIKRLQNVPKNSSAKATTIFISLFVILMVAGLFSSSGVILIDHYVSFALGIVFAVFIYKVNFHFSKLTRNGQSTNQSKEVL